MKKIHKLIILSSLFLLTSCGNIFVTASIYHGGPIDSPSSNVNSSSESGTSSNSNNSSSSSINNDGSSNSSVTSEDSENSSTISSSEGGPLGYVKGPLKTKITDINPSYTQNTGNINTLVVPIDLSYMAGSNAYTFDTFSDDVISFINQSYFGNESPAKVVDSILGGGEKWYSFKKYYETASFGKVTVNGMVAPVRQVIGTLPSTREDLYDIINSAAYSVQSELTDVDWSQYDLNNDGYFDSVHFITNVHVASDAWGSIFWPHMGGTGKNKVSTGRITTNVYSISSINYFENANTAIHEQGHMLGLDDYYDYSDSSPKFAMLGNSDMQESEYFDWNIYSKLLVGWANPTVITGERDSVTLELNASSINGDCLIIPANYSTYNKTPFDEYFLLELFSTESNINNALGLKFYNNEAGHHLPSYGVKIYHVNATFMGYNQSFDKYYYYDGTADSLSNVSRCTYISTACNNSRDYDSYFGGSSATYKGDSTYANYPLISIVSKQDSGKFTSSGSANKTLADADLFGEGDTFNFGSAMKALMKNATVSLNMNKGETFPYTITFNSVNSQKMVLTVSK